MGTLNVFEERYSPKLLGSVIIPEKLKQNIIKYSKKFDDMKKSMSGKSAKTNSENFKVFISNLFEKIEKEIQIKHKANNLVLTGKVKTHKNKKTPKDMQKQNIELVLKSIEQQLQKSIKEESTLIEEKKSEGDDFDESEIITDKDFKNLSKSTKQIFNELDKSSLKDLLEYKDIKTLLKKYIVNKLQENTHLRKNCLTLFNELQLKLKL